MRYKPHRYLSWSNLNWVRLNWAGAILLLACMLLPSQNALGQVPQLHELQMLSARAAYAYRSGRLKTALSLSTVVAEGTRLRFGDNHLKYAQALNNLALFQDLAGALPEAEQNYRRAIHIVQALGGSHLEQLAELKNNLAAVVLQNCHLKEARQLYIESLKLTTSVYGASHSDVYMVRANLNELDRYMTASATATFVAPATKPVAHTTGLALMLRSCVS